MVSGRLERRMFNWVKAGNDLNPLVAASNGVMGFMTGENIYGEPQTVFSSSVNLAGAALPFGIIGRAAKTSTKLPTQIHHFATNKHSLYTKQMGDIAKQYGLELNGAWNKAAMPHLGRHPNAYHDFVLKGMQDAAAGAGGNQAKFLQLFDQYVKQPVL